MCAPVKEEKSWVSVILSEGRGSRAWDLEFKLNQLPDRRVRVQMLRETQEKEVQGAKHMEAGNKDNGEKSCPASILRYALDVGGSSVWISEKNHLV